MVERPTKFNAAARHFPLTPATVDINGNVYSPRSTIWAGLRLHRAVWRSAGMYADDHHLAVPWCHIEDGPGAECTYRVRSRLEGWVFVKARNGAWVLQEIQS